MSNEIVTQTCPAPECNLTIKIFTILWMKMTEYVGMFSPGFGGRSSWNGVRDICKGCWGMRRARTLSGWHLSWVRMYAVWSILLDKAVEEEPVVAIHQRLVGETLGEVDGVALIDESSVVKQGDDSVGVGAQYCGSVG